MTVYEKHAFLPKTKSKIIIYTWMINLQQNITQVGYLKPMSA